MKKYNITVNGTKYEVIVEEAGSSASHTPYYSAPAAPAATSSASSPSSKPVHQPNAGSTKVVAPMPGTILDMKVSVGQAVKRGQVICVLEAMKMENEIPAPADGVVVSVNVQKGATVAANDILVSLN